MPVRVVPDGRQWVVEEMGRELSRHNDKRRAKTKARRVAGEGGLMVVHDADGRIMDRVTVGT